MISHNKRLADIDIGGSLGLHIWHGCRNAGRAVHHVSMVSPLWSWFSLESSGLHEGAGTQAIW
jgi:hypothetical protein